MLVCAVAELFVSLESGKHSLVDVKSLTLQVLGYFLLSFVLFPRVYLEVVGLIHSSPFDVYVKPKVALVVVEELLDFLLSFFYDVSVEVWCLWIFVFKTEHLAELLLCLVKS